MKADASTEQAISETFQRYIDAINNPDVAVMGQLVERSPDTVIIGTDQEERFVGWDAFRDELERNLATHPAGTEQDTYTSTWQHVAVSPQGDTAWFATEGSLRIEAPATGQALNVPMRFTAVLVRNEESPTGWALAQGHVSVPASLNPQVEGLTQQQSG